MSEPYVEIEIRIMRDGAWYVMSADRAKDPRIEISEDILTESEIGSFDRPLGVGEPERQVTFTFTATQREDGNLFMETRSQ